MQIIRQKTVYLRPLISEKQIMHQYNYTSTSNKLLVAEIVKLLTELYECKGRQDLYIENAPEILKSLMDQAQSLSAISTCSITGSDITAEQLHALAENDINPNGRAEEEAIGYYQALTSIYEDYENIPISTDTICKLHEKLYRYTPGVTGGKLKQNDFVVAETMKDGSEKVQFVPVKSGDTRDSLNTLCNKFNEAMQKGSYSPLLLIPIFTLDFLCIRPFKHGSGRISRLLTLLLLYKQGFFAGKYVSLEKIVAENIDTYHSTLRESADGWHNNSNNYMPFVRFYLELIRTTYERFQERVELRRNGKLSKADRVKSVFEKKMGRIKKRDIAACCPDISMTTIERTLAELLANGSIEKVGSARATAYILKK